MRLPGLFELRSGERDEDPPVCGPGLSAGAPDFVPAWRSGGGGPAGDPAQNQSGAGADDAVRSNNWCHPCQ